MLHLPGSHKLNRNFSGFPHVPLAATKPLIATAWAWLSPQIYPNQVPVPESPPTCSWGRESSGGVLGNNPVRQGLRCSRAWDHPGRTRQERTENGPLRVSQTPSASPHCCLALHLPGLVIPGPSSLLQWVTLRFTQQAGSAWNQTSLPTFLPGNFAPPPFCQTSSFTFIQTAPEEIPCETSL